MRNSPDQRFSGFAAENATNAMNPGRGPIPKERAMLLTARPGKPTRLAGSLEMAVRPEGANHHWRKIPPGELSIDPVADERPGGRPIVASYR
jgi:hypothetical protein